MRLSIRNGLAVFAFATAVSCQDLPADPAEWQLTDGRELGDLAIHGPPAVVMVISPSDLPACQSVIVDWLDRARRSGERFDLVLSREPTSVENRTLITLGIRPTALLRTPPRGDVTPVELLLHQGETRFAAYRVRGPDSPLRTRLGDRPLSAFAASPRSAVISDPHPSAKEKR